MAVNKNKETPDFDVEDDVLLLEQDIELDDDEVAEVGAVKGKSSSALKQHKYIDYTRALAAC